MYAELQRTESVEVRIKSLTITKLKTQITNYLFLYTPIMYAYHRRDQLNVKIFYFPLEETAENIDPESFSKPLLEENYFYFYNDTFINIIVCK